MTEFFASSFLGVTFFMIGLVGIFLISLFIADYNDSFGSLIVCTAIFVAVNYQWGSLDLAKFLDFKYISGYLLVGILFSFLRTWLLGKKLTEQEKKYLSLKSKVFRWIFFWPISLPNWIFSDVINQMWHFFYSKMEKLYLAFLNGKF
jgi:hypothetical protein